MMYGLQGFAAANLDAYALIRDRLSQRSHHDRHSP
jgi:hypothetical protein